MSNACVLSFFTGSFVSTFPPHLAAYSDLIYQLSDPTVTAAPMSLKGARRLTFLSATSTVTTPRLFRSGRARLSRPALSGALLLTLGAMLLDLLVLRARTTRPTQRPAPSDLVARVPTCPLSTSHPVNDTCHTGDKR